MRTLKIINAKTCQVHIHCTILHAHAHARTHTHTLSLSLSLSLSLQAGRSRVRFPMRPLDFFNLPNPSSCTVALGSTQPLIEMSIRNLPEGVNSGRSIRLTAICWPIDQKMWDPRCLTTLWAFRPVTGIALSYLHK
jgi:hypothetical protein